MTDAYYKRIYKRAYRPRSLVNKVKFRSLATNTVAVKTPEIEDPAVDRKIKELLKAITSRVNKQIQETEKSRDVIKIKFENLDNKIESMLLLQNVVTGLRKDLTAAENNLADVVKRIERISRNFSITTESESTTVADFGPFSAT